MKKLNKHFMTVTSKHKVRPILSGIHFSSELNKIIATDAHRLLTWKQEIENSVTLNFETLEYIDGQYPDTERLIPTIFKGVTTVKTEMITSDIIKELTKNKKNMLEVRIASNGLVFRFMKDRKELGGFSMPDFFEESSIEEETFYCNVEYMRDLFQFLMDYEKEYKGEVVEFGYTSPIRPFLFTSDRFEYLVTPIRVDR